MDLTIATTLNDSLTAPRPVRALRATTSYQTPSTTTENLPAATTSSTKSTAATGTRLVDETQEQTSDGYRKISTFEQTDGRRFTRIEDFAFTDQGAKRNVIQQNPSGSITRYEEVLDREDSGNFRRTQRFQDGAGDVATQITADYEVTDPFVLTGGITSGTYGSSPAFAPLRGTQLDLHA